MRTDGETDERLVELKALLYREVPLSRHMGVAPDCYDGETLTLNAELEPNINIHGTAFGGSTYSLAALCGWSLLRLRLEELALHPKIMLSTGHIDYRRPVRSRLIARASCESSTFETFADRIRNGGRASLEVPVTLGSMQDTRWVEAAVFKGLYTAV